jgi:Ca-activated chloride channel homolog
MEFLNPTALLGLFALPLLLIPYLTKKRPRRLTFSSLILFTQSGTPTSRGPWGRVHLPPVFFLQLLLLTLLVLALSEPVFSVRPTRIAIVLDNSASMQALEQGKARLVLAQQKAQTVTAELGGGGRVDIYTTTPRLQRVNAEPLAPAQANRVIAGVKAYDLADAPIEYDQSLGALAHEQNYQRIYLITDHPAGSQGTIARVISVGAAQPNLAITAFDVHRSSIAATRLEASATITNFSSRDEKLRIALKTNGTTLTSRDVTVPTGKPTTVVFEGFPAHPTYEVEIDRSDALPLDNRRFAVAPASRNLRILAVTPRPQAAASLKSIPGVTVDVIAPVDYGKAIRSGYSLEIFHFAAPATLPDNSSLFILPPEANPVVESGAPVGSVQVSSWREPHELTRYINFSLFRPTYARPLKPKTAGDIIIDSPNGPLAFALEHRAARYLFLGFDPLPYLGRENLPISIFTLNFLDWFLDSAGTKAQGTAEPIALGAVESGDTVVTPGGKNIALNGRATVFQDTYEQGIYEWRHGRETRWFARNLAEEQESDLRAPRRIDLHDTAKAPGASSAMLTFWPYLLIASLLLFVLEWFISPRMTRVLLRRRTVQAA